MNSDGSGHKRITIVPHAATTFQLPAWSPDGRWLTIIDGGCVLRSDGRSKCGSFEPTAPG